MRIIIRRTCPPLPFNRDRSARSPSISTIRCGMWSLRSSAPNATLRAWLTASCPDMAARYGREALFEIRSALIAEDTPPPARRERAAGAGAEGRPARLRLPGGEAERLARAGFEVFLASRHVIEYYGHAAEVLRALGRRYLIGALTNGNADVRRLDIGPLFHFAIQAGDVGMSKPAPGHVRGGDAADPPRAGRDRARRRPPGE